MKIRLSYLKYLVLGVVLFYAFFLWQFPYDQLKKGIIQNLEEALPLTVSISRVRPSFPAGLRLENIRAGADSISFRIPDLTLSPNVLGLLLGGADFALRDSINPSRLEGRFRQEKNMNRLNIRLNQMEIQTSSPKEFAFGVKLSGEATLQWEGDDWEKGNGQAWALLERSEIQGAQISQVPLPLTLFDTLRAEIQLKEGILRVKRLEASGKDTRFSLPKDLQFSLKGGLPPDLGFIFQLPQK